MIRNAWPYPYTKSGITPTNLRDEYLFGLALQSRDGKAYPDRAVWSHIRAAEDELERDLQIFLTPTRIMSEPTDAELAAAIAEGDGGNRVKVDRALDYDDEYFIGDRWGMTLFRYRPIKRIRQFFFGYPSRTQRVIEIPTNWLRIDQNYGATVIIPNSAGVFTSFGAYLFSLFGSGRDIPQCIFVDYDAGFTEIELRDEYHDVLDAVQRVAAMRCVPQIMGARWAEGESRSVSADCVSQSRGGVMTVV